MRLIRGTAGTVSVSSTNAVTLNVNSRTDMFRNISGAVTWTPDGSGGYKTTNPIVITNTFGEGVIISLTKLKWSFDQVVPKPQRMMSFRFSAQDLAFCETALDEINVQQTTASSEGVTVEWDQEALEQTGRAVLTITAPATFEKAFRDGNEIAGYQELPDGTRQWTYTVSADELGEYTCDITLEDNRGYLTQAISSGVIVITPPAEETPDEGGNADGTGSSRWSFRSLLETILNFFRKLLGFFKIETA